MCARITSLLLLLRGGAGRPRVHSVFNKGQKGITGAFTAEQFDRQLRTGSLAAKGQRASGAVEHARGDADAGGAGGAVSAEERLRRRQAVARAADARARGAPASMNPAD